MGTKLKGRIPSLGDAEAEFIVDYIAPMGAFATWRPTLNAGSYDLKTFEVHARPQKLPQGLRPGMSVIFPPLHP